MNEEGDERGEAAVDRDGERQVPLRLRVPGRAGAARADAAHRPLLPDDDAGARGVPGRLALRPRRHRQDRVGQGARQPARPVRPRLQLRRDVRLPGHGTHLCRPVSGECS